MSNEFLNPLDEIDAKVDETGMEMMDKLNKDYWSTLDAASEKLQPSIRLPVKAVNAIQGFIDYPNALSE